MRKTASIALIGLVLLLGGLTACDKGGKKAPANTTPIDQLIQAGKPPVEIGHLTRGISPVAPTFTVAVTNVSDRPVSLLSGVVLFYDEAGAYIPDSKTEMGYSDVSPIAAGARIELQTMTRNEKAVAGKWIIKQVIYSKPAPVKGLGELDFKWTNKDFDAEVAAAEAKK
jgi:hypothetical protein